MTRGPVRLDRTTPPFAFPADAAVSASLIDGPITDLNVMTRRGRFRDRTRRIADDAALEIADGGAPALLLAATPCRAAVDGFPAVDLGRLDALLIPAAGVLPVDATGQPIPTLAPMLERRAPA